MALKVEDGTVRDDTVESYSSISDADNYIARWHDDSTWSGSTQSEKERALLKATRFVDDHTFIGQRSDPDQALAWPRVWIGSIDGRVIASNEIPREIKEATIEAALRQRTGDTLFPDHDGGTIRSESKQVGDLSISQTFASSRQATRTFEVIRSLLRPFLQANRGLERTL